MNYKTLTKVGAGLFALALLAGCSTTSKNSGGTAAVEQKIKLTVPQEPPSIDLSLATDTISFSLLNNVYEGLYRVDKDGIPQPAGAKEKATVSEDGLTYTVKLREDAKWSNGDALKASDYVFAWQRTVEPKTAAEYASLFFSIENAEEINKGKKDKSTLGIKAIDDHTLEIKLNVPIAYMDYLFAFPSFFPQNEKVATEQGKNYAKKSTNSVYNGPFTLEEFNGAGSSTEWLYKKNTNYWDAATVKLEEAKVNVVKETSTGLNLYQAGEADDVIINAEQAKQLNKDKAYYPAKEARTSYIEFNREKGKNKEAWKNTNLRQALSAAIDRKGLVDKVLGDGSTISTGLIPSEMSLDPKTEEDFAKEVGNQSESSKEAAKSYWDKAKSELGIKDLTINILSSDDDNTKKVAQKIQADLQENLSGVKVELTPVPFTVRLDRSTTGDFDIVLGGWAADYADPSSFTDLFVTGGAYNRGHYSSKEYDKLIKETTTTLAAKPEERWDNFKKATDLLIKQEMGVIPVYQKSEAHLINPKIKGIVHHTSGPSWEYKWAYVE